MISLIKLIKESPVIGAWYVTKLRGVEFKIVNVKYKQNNIEIMYTYTENQTPITYTTTLNNFNERYALK